MFGANSDWFSCERKFSHKLPTKHKIHKKFSTAKNPTSWHTYKANANLPLHKTGLKCCTTYMDTGSFFYIQTLIYVWSLCLYNWKWEHTSSAFSSSPCVSRKEITLSSFLFLFLLPLKTLAPTPRLLPAIWECVDMWGWTVEHQSINNTFYYTYMSLTPVKTMKRLFFFHSAKWATRPELYPRW